MMAEQEVYFDDGDYLRVIASLRVLAEANPSDEESWSNLFWMLGNVEAYGEAWAATRKFARLNPTSAEPAFHEAQFLFSKRMWAKVPAILEPALRAEAPPKDSVSYRLLAASYFRLGWWEDSRRVSLELLKRWPADEIAKANVRKCDERLAGG
jgi:tetratricopeptide (TPR) repeat protein